MALFSHANTETEPELQPVFYKATTLDNTARLVETSQEGDLEAFGKLVERFQKMALALAYYRLGDFHLAQDVAQEAFVEAYINLAKLLEPAAFPGWFRKIVLKRIDRVTRGKLAATPLLGLTDAEAFAAPISDPLRQAEINETNSELHELIERLPAIERTAIVLFYLHAYSQNEIASFLEVPLTTVKKRLYSGRQHLKENLGNPQGQPFKKEKQNVSKNILPEKVQFLLAVRAGDLKKVEAFLSKDPTLVLATEEWDEEISRQIYVPMEQGQTALWRATHNGHLEMVELILAKSRGLNRPLPLEEAVLMGHFNIAEVFIRAGAEVNIPLRNGLSLLTIAVIRENVALVRLLLAHGAEINFQCRNKRTPLHWAVLKGNALILKHLLISGADPYTPDMTEETPLKLAQSFDNQAVLNEFKPFITPG